MVLSQVVKAQPIPSPVTISDFTRPFLLTETAAAAKTILEINDPNDTAYGAWMNTVTDEAPSLHVFWTVISGLSGGHDAVTVADSSSIDFTLNGQLISADVNETWLSGLAVGDMLKAIYDVLENGFVDGNDTAYNATSWDNNPDAPTMNSVRDVIEGLPGGHDAVTLDTNMATIYYLTSQAIEVNLASPTDGRDDAISTSDDIYDFVIGLNYLDTESDPIFLAADSNDITHEIRDTWDDAYTHSQLTSGNPHSVTPAELNLEIGTDVQAYDANLTTLSAPTAWRVFYVDGDAVISEFALGTDGQYLKSNGADQIPSWDTPGGAGDMLKATYDTDDDGFADPNETELEALLELQDLQGAVTDSQVPDNITITEADPIFGAADSNDITHEMRDEWDTAYGWGDWSGEGFLTSESDPVFLAADSNDITHEMRDNWDTSLNHKWLFNIRSPKLDYDSDPNISIDPNTTAALTITKVEITLDADPTTELNWNLYFADTYIAKANETLIGAIDTTSGIANITSFDDATIPAHKAVYIKHDAAPDTSTKEANVKIYWDYD